MINKIKEYLESPDFTTLSKTTKDNYLRALNHYEEWLGKGGESFDEFVKSLEKNSKIGPASIQQYITRIKVFHKWAGDPLKYTYKISNNARKENKAKHLKRWFNENEIAECLAYKFQKSPDEKDRIRNRIIVRLLIETGARVRELSFVQANNVDLEDRIIWLYDSKTEPRPAFFSPATQDMFNYFKRSCVYWEGNIFPEVDSIKYLVTEMLRDLGFKNGKDGRGPHTFRHYCASYLFYRGGMRIQDIAFLLGDQVETIVSRYLHPTPLMLRERVDKAMRWEI